MSAPDLGDDLERAALAAGIDGAEALLERDRAALARGFGHIAAGRESAGAAVIGKALRRTTMFRGPGEALLRLDAAADAAGMEREQALRYALAGVLNETTPRL